MHQRQLGDRSIGCEGWYCCACIVVVLGRLKRALRWEFIGILRDCLGLEEEDSWFRGSAVLLFERFVLAVASSSIGSLVLLYLLCVQPKQTPFNQKECRHVVVWAPIARHYRHSVDMSTGHRPSRR